jgi:hypothetical protein
MTIFTSFGCGTSSNVISTRDPGFGDGIVIGDELKFPCIQHITKTHHQNTSSKHIIAAISDPHRTFYDVLQIGVTSSRKTKVKQSRHS